MVTPNDGMTIDEALRVVDRGEVVACVGLICTLYFDGPASDEVRQRIVTALEYFLQRTDANAWKWSMNPTTHRAVRIGASEVLSVPSRALATIPAGKTFEVMMHGGDDVGDAHPYRVIVGAGTRTNVYSYFSVGVPFEWIASNDPGTFTQLIVELAERLRPSHGYAGLGAVGHVDTGPNDPALGSIVPMVQRFKGLEIDLPTSHSIYTKQENAIKGINWLTVLDQSWIDRLGGDATLRAQLGPSSVVHPYSEGWVIQAGPRPQFGDRNRNEPMDAYEQVARALKPIRVSSIRGVASAYGFDRARADEWLARFD